MALTGSSIVASLLVKEYAAFLNAFLLAFLFLVGAIKASLVLMFFMRLRFESKIIWALGFTALLFVGFFIAGTLFDIIVTEKR